MKKKKTLIIIFVVIAVLIGGGVIALKQMSIRGREMGSEVPKMEGYVAYLVDKVPDLSLTGKIVPEKNQNLIIPNGKLDQLNVKDGQEVKSGDVILTVTDTQKEEAIENQNSVVNKTKRLVTSANNALKNAQNTYNQADAETKSSLKDALTKAQQDLNDANSDLNEENSKLTELQNKLHVNLTAPFDGIVTVAENGSKDGMPNITIASKQKILQTTVSEYDFNKVHVDDEINVTGIEGTPSQKTKIIRINQVPNNPEKGTAYYEVFANANDDFLYGQSVKIKVPQKGIKIPESAVYNGYIYKVIEGKARKVKADVTKSGDSYLVNSGVAKGEKIVLNPDEKIKDGEKVND
jgi:HlyD family secretion protein